MVASHILFQPRMALRETAKVFGVPFELIPFKVEGGAQQPPWANGGQPAAAPAGYQPPAGQPPVNGAAQPPWATQQPGAVAAPVGAAPPWAQ